VHKSMRTQEVNNRHSMCTIVSMTHSKVQQDAQLAQTHVQARI